MSVVRAVALTAPHVPSRIGWNTTDHVLLYREWEVLLLIGVRHLPSPWSSGTIFNSFHSHGCSLKYFQWTVFKDLIELTSWQ